MHRELALGGACLRSVLRELRLELRLDGFQLLARPRSKKSRFRGAAAAAQGRGHSVRKRQLVDATTACAASTFASCSSCCAFKT